MTIFRAFAIAAIAASFGAGQAPAQAVSSEQAPAEFPPASYTGRQYVDSNGCVFVRAGIDGNVSWIPRVSRKRKVICGFQPSIPGAAGTRTVAASQPAAAEPVQITVADPAVKPAAAPAKPAPKKVVAPPAPKPKPAPKPVVVARPKPVQPAPKAVTVKPVVKPLPKTVTMVRAKPAAKPAKMAPRQSACRGRSAISSRYMTNSAGLPVRCGPQATGHVTIINGGSARTLARSAPVIVTPAPSQPRAASDSQPVSLKRAPTSRAVTGQTRIVPKSVYENQVASLRGVYIPKGYKPTWDDDRLNPKRAHQTYDGHARMQLRWTNTVPRRLIDANTGAEVAYMYPGLQYPYTSYDQQMIAGVTVSTKGAAAQPLRRQSANQTRASMEEKPARAQQTTQAQAQPRQVQPKATVSTRSTAARAPSHRYVQAGMWDDMVHAQRAAQKIANSGLPAKLGKRTRSGKTYGVVVTGPFRTQARLNAALQQVRAMGFGGAFLRK